MSIYSRNLLAGVAVATLAALAACSPTATSDPGTGSAASSNAAGASQSQAAQPKPTLPTNGKCELIGTDKATALVGSTVTSSSSTTAAVEGIALIDGCTFVGAPGTLTYNVLNFTGVKTASAFVTQTKTALAGIPGATPFDVTGGDASVGFTTVIGAEVTATIGVAKGTYEIGVTSTATDAETAKKIATSTLAILLDAVG